MVFGYLGILSSGFTVSLEIFGEKFDISSGVRAEQLERPAHHCPIYFTILDNLLRMSLKTLYSTPGLDTSHLDGQLLLFQSDLDPTFIA